jgi:hypothetical protein
MQKQAAGAAFYRKVHSSPFSSFFHNHLLISFPPQNGFRLIGLTPFLAYSPDPSHLSRKLSIASDPETPSVEFESINPTAPNLSPAEIRAKYPLHRAIGINKTSSVAAIILAAHQANAGNVRMRDVYGLTPVHIATASDNAHALRTLLSLDPLGIAEDLQDSKNQDGITPIEGLEISMRSARESMETLVGVWRGYSDDALICEYLLKKAMGLPMVAAGEEEYIKKRKFGCTCGMCTDGWLSPRMRFQLLGGR